MIRAAAVEDASALAAVHVLSWQAAYRGLIPQDFLDRLDPAVRAQRWTRALTEPRPGDATLVAETAGRLVGFANVGRSRDDGAPPEQGELRSIYVDPEWWDTGAGRALIRAGSDALQAAGFDHAVLWVLIENVRARRFYERGGWTPDGAIQPVGDFTGVEEIRYRRALA